MNVTAKERIWTFPPLMDHVISIDFSASFTFGNSPKPFSKLQLVTNELTATTGTWESEKKAGSFCTFMVYSSVKMDQNWLD